jgi:mycofactocin biosynthesis protein MftB
MATAATPGTGLVHEDGAWRLSESVALRPEPFGALAYDFVSRRLSFLKTPRLVEVVRSLGGSPDVAAALTSAGVGDLERAAYLAALEELAAGGLIQERVA